MRSANARQCHHLAAALLGQVDHISAVPGKPVSHLIDTLAAWLPSLEWAMNEKTAAETAVGLSAAGTRSCVIMKHNGFSLALDSLLNAALHTTGAAILVVVGDDPDATSSTSAQDSREIAEAARLPVLEPALDGDLDEVVGAAVRMSESLATPVLIRVTHSLHERCAATARPDPPGRPGRRERPASPPGRTVGVDLAAAHGLTKLGRVQRQRLVTLPGVQAMVDGPGFATATCGPTCETALVAVGAAAGHLDGIAHEHCRLVLRAGWPLPAMLVDFVDKHQTTVVVEEPSPALERFLRRHVADRDAVTGRLTGHLPPEGALSAGLVSRALVGPSPDAWRTPDRKPAAPPPLSRYDTLFRAVSRVHRSGTFVAADVGSAVRLCYPPYDAAEVALCLGSAIAVAGGAARTGRPAVGVVGDYAILHSGLASLLEAAHYRLPVLVVVLDNGVQAQTGGQPTPPVGLGPLVEACGVPDVDSWPVDSLDADATFERLTQLLRGRRPAVALVSG